MAIKIGVNDAKKIYVGTSEIASARVWTTKVRPAWWTPWSNTIAYYPLTSSTTVNDTSGNNKNLSKTWTVTFGTYWWVSCAYTQNQHSNNAPVNYLSTDSISLPTNMTVSMWVQPSTNKAGVTTCWTFWTWRPQMYWLWIWTYYNNWEACIWDFSWTYEKIWNNLWISSWNWYNMIVVKEWTKSTVYKNGTLVWDYTWLQSSIWQRFMLCDTYSSWWLTWYMSEVIVESKLWTATEVSNYFNSMKSNYWL